MFFFGTAILNAELCAESGGVGSILKSTVTCQLPRINEALVATVIYLMNHPNTRQHVRMGVDLEVNFGLGIISLLNMKR